MQATRKIGMPWYTREGFEAARGVMTDQHALAPTFDEWRLSAEHNEQVARSVGIEVIRAVIEADTFSAWCATRNVPPDSKARTTFAEEAARQGGPGA